MNDDINVNEEMKRAHELALFRTVARYVVAGLALLGLSISGMASCAKEKKGNFYRKQYEVRALACEMAAKRAKSAR